MARPAQASTVDQQALSITAWTTRVHGQHAHLGHAAVAVVVGRRRNSVRTVYLLEAFVNHKTLTNHAFVNMR